VAIVKHSRHHTYSPIYYDRESTDSPHVSMHSTLHIHSIADLLLYPLLLSTIAVKQFVGYQMLTLKYF